MRMCLFQPFSRLKSASRLYSTQGASMHSREPERWIGAARKWPRSNTRMVAARRQLLGLPGCAQLSGVVSAKGDGEARRDVHGNEVSERRLLVRPRARHLTRVEQLREVGRIVLVPMSNTHAVAGRATPLQ